MPPITIVTGDAEDPDDENAVRYEVELEIADPSLIPDRSHAEWYAHSGVLKAFDLIRMCR